MVMAKDRRFEIAAWILAILGVFFMVMAAVAPAEQTEFEFQYPQLAWLVKLTPTGVHIVGTGAQAAQLQFVIGVILVVVAYLIYRRA
jgi:tellurite resistance protein TehA-like permease